MLDIENLTVEYGDETAVENLSLTVENGEFVTLLGPSGCGKTTTLLCIAGHIQPAGGRVHLAGEDVTRKPPERRSVGVVFQQGALFPHMTARENVSYALGPQDCPAEECRRRTDEQLSLVGVADQAAAYPSELSGGQRRRVELARALVYDPDVLLLDEPLTGLDRGLQQDLRRELARIHDETDVTTVYVTHDQTDALTLSDRAAVLRDGTVVDSGPPRDLYGNPSAPFVASFIGDVSRLPTTVVGTNPLVVEWEGHRFAVDAPAVAEGSGAREESVSLFLRPEAVEWDDTARDVVLDARLVGVEHAGATSTATVETAGGTRLQVAVGGFPELQAGDTMTVGFDLTDVLAFVDDEPCAVSSTEHRGVSGVSVSYGRESTDTL